MLRIAATKLGLPATCSSLSVARGMAVESLKGFKEAESVSCSSGWLLDR